MAKETDNPFEEEQTEDAPKSQQGLNFGVRLGLMVVVLGIGSAGGYGIGRMLHGGGSADPNKPQEVEDVLPREPEPVDIAGEETSFTSFGENVAVHANGFEVESYLPGGDKIEFSGTSMASPNVANLAAKLFAVDPSLTCSEVMDYIKKVFEHLKDENEMLKLQLEQQPINEVIDLSGFTEMFINKGE